MARVAAMNLRLRRAYPTSMQGLGQIRPETTISALHALSQHPHKRYSICHSEALENRQYAQRDWYIDRLGLRIHVIA
jgi:hypothetical protein